MFQQKLSEIANLLMLSGYPGIFVAMFLEGLSIPFPGTLIILFAGYMVLEGDVSFWFAVIVAAVGYTVGTLVPYFLMYLGRTAILEKVGRFIFISPEKFNKYGSSMVCFSRPFFFGNYISFLAGMAHMQPVKYIIYTFFGAYFWCASLIYIGYLFGKNWRNAVDVISEYSTVLIIVIIIFVGIFFYSFIMKKRKKFF